MVVIGSGDQCSEINFVLRSQIIVACRSLSAMRCPSGRLARSNGAAHPSVPRRRRPQLRCPTTRITSRRRSPRPPGGLEPDGGEPSHSCLLGRGLTSKPTLTSDRTRHSASRSLRTRDREADAASEAWLSPHRDSKPAHQRVGHCETLPSVEPSAVTCLAMGDGARDSPQGDD